MFKFFTAYDFVNLCTLSILVIQAEKQPNSFDSSSVDRIVGGKYCLVQNYISCILNNAPIIFLGLSDVS